MWNLEEALTYYKQQGAPADQSALVSLLREAQRENGNAIPKAFLTVMAEALGVKENYLLAVIKRIPSLRISDTHCLELCGGPNCGKRAALAAFVEKTYGVKPEKFELRYVPCMRMCGKGPNIRWDGKIYHGADETLIRKLIEE
jgi:NADH:ubiquinone oxidoreductase subunit E